MLRSISHNSLGNCKAFDMSVELQYHWLPKLPIGTNETRSGIFLSASMDDISLQSLKDGENRAWLDFYEHMRPLAVSAIGNEKYNFLLDDVVQESAKALCMRRDKENFGLHENVKLSTFMFRVARNQFLRILKKRGVVDVQYVDEMAAIEETMDDLIDNDKRWDCVEKHWGLEGFEKCKALLYAYYFLRKSMAEIALEQGYASARVVITKKGRCLKILEKLCPD